VKEVNGKTPAGNTIPADQLVLSRPVTVTTELSQLIYIYITCNLLDDINQAPKTAE
jgi:hypothetical protein